MKQLDPALKDLTPRHLAIYWRYQVVRSAVDFGAATCLVIGSAFFLFASITRAPQAFGRYLDASARAARRDVGRTSKRLSVPRLGNGAEPLGEYQEGGPQPYPRQR